MTAVATTSAAMETLADVLEQLGGIAPHRVRFLPPPGLATEEDVLALRQAATRRLYELVDGILVEKAMGFRESYLAGVLLTLISNFVGPRHLGIVLPPDGMMRLAAGLVRLPDVAFLSWERLPQRRIPTEPIPAVVPDLAVEVLSAGNTVREMSRKRQEYFAAGVQIVWLIDPEARTVEVYTAPEQSIRLDATQTLEGGTVLPGFALALQEFFATLDAP